MYSDRLKRIPAQLDVSKQMYRFIGEHPFIQKISFMYTEIGRRQKYTKTGWRKFVQNIYDYARALGLKKPEAEVHVTRARGFCGATAHDSGASTLDGEEVDNIAAVLKRYRTASGWESEASPPIDEESNTADYSKRLSATKTNEEKAAREAAKKARRLAHRRRPSSQTKLNGENSGVPIALKRATLGEDIKEQNHKNKRRSDIERGTESTDLPLHKGRKRRKKDNNEDRMSINRTSKVSGKKEEQRVDFQIPMIHSA